MAEDDVALVPGEMEWLADLAALPPDQEVAPGVRAAELLAFHSRPPTPPGWLFEPKTVFSSHIGRGDLVAHLYRPADPRPARPGVVLVHGGGWNAGSPFSQIRRACLLAEHGYVAATISYRRAPEALFPAPLEDVKCAIRWLRSDAARLGLDPSRIAVAGDSAGGHLAVLAALTTGRWEGDGGHDAESSAVQAAALWYPITDLRPAGKKQPSLGNLVEPFLGTLRPRSLAEASPISWVRPGGPPVFTITGEDDVIARSDAARAFHRALDEAGVENTLVVIPGEGHAFDYLPRLWEESFRLALEFLDASLERGSDGV